LSTLYYGRQCKYLVKVFQHGRLIPADTYFIDMDYCPETLENWIKRRGNAGDEQLLSLTPVDTSVESSAATSTADNDLDPVVFGILEDISAGLEYIHSHGFVHRDLKPSNGKELQQNPLTPSLVFQTGRMLEVNRLWISSECQFKPIRYHKIWKRNGMLPSARDISDAGKI
jgi:hypothetical protein